MATCITLTAALITVMPVLRLMQLGAGGMLPEVALTTAVGGLACPRRGADRSARSDHTPQRLSILHVLHPCSVGYILLFL